MGVREEQSGRAEVVVRGPDAPTSVRLLDRSRVDEYETVFTVEVVDEGLRARTEVTVTAWDGMSEFFDGLARDFRGWEDERVWVNDNLVVTAAFGSGGHIRLSWTLRSGFASDFAPWTCTVTTVMEAGEGMTAAAADLRKILRRR